MSHYKEDYCCVIWNDLGAFIGLLLLKEMRKLAQTESEEFFLLDVERSILADHFRISNSLRIKTTLQPN